MPSDIATNNSNYRLVRCTSTKPTKTPTGCESDTYSKNFLEHGSVERKHTHNLDLEQRDADPQRRRLLRLQARTEQQLAFDHGRQARPSASSSTPPRTAGSNRSPSRSTSATTPTSLRPATSRRKTSTSCRASTCQGSHFDPDQGRMVQQLAAPTSSSSTRRTATSCSATTRPTSASSPARPSISSNNAIVKQDAGFSLPTALNPWKSVESSDPESGEEGTPGVFYEPQTYVECSGAAAPGQPPDSDC